MTDELAALLARFSPAVAETAAALVAMIERIRPDLEPRVRPGWGSVNFRHPKAGFLCAVFPGKDNVDLVFEHGRQLSSPLLQGEGRQVRYIRLTPGAALPEYEIGILLVEAIALRA